MWDLIVEYIAHPLWDAFIAAGRWAGPEYAVYVGTGILSLLVIVPCPMLFRRVGKSPLWAIFALLPLGFFIIAWILAFSAWPREREA